ncbi:MAG: hypothetical protein APF84_02075 [Gracilibacter sp. BRH_c7a]|nr:MAG: hypothetical protein APF84_02075 [Gracilibacter sp. BRH_c7a]
MSSIFMFIVFIVLVGFLLNIFTSIWAYRDSLNKGNSKEYSVIVLIGTLFFPIIGLIIYLIIRND